MNLSTFSEMKRTLPSSATRKKNPSMDSRWGKPSHRNGGSDFSRLLTDTSAVYGWHCHFYSKLSKYKSNNIPPIDEDVPQSLSPFFDSSSGNTEGKQFQISGLNLIWEEQFSTTCSEHFKFKNSFTLDEISLFLNIR